MISFEHLIKSIDQDLPFGGSYSDLLHQSLIDCIKENNFPIVIFQPDNGIYGYCISLQETQSPLLKDIEGFYGIESGFNTIQDVYDWIYENLGTEFNNYIIHDDLI